jgi:hypothetical protein
MDPPSRLIERLVRLKLQLFVLQQQEAGGASKFAILHKSSQFTNLRNFDVIDLYWLVAGL